MGNFKSELSNYQNVPRELVFDKDLSDRARFVYVFMACKPDDWDFYLEPMAKDIGYSVDTLRKYINELVTSGWLTKGEQTNENGVFGAVGYTLKATKNTDTENFRHGNNQPQINKDIIENKEINNKEEDNNKLLSPKKKSKRFVKPTIEQIQAYITEKGYTFDAEAFFAFYESNGWKVGKNPMKSWKAACTTWSKDRRNNSRYNNNNFNNYGRETITDKIRRTLEDSEQFQQKLDASIREADLDFEPTDEEW
jgi:hypothetical protein